MRCRVAAVVAAAISGWFYQVNLLRCAGVRSDHRLPDSGLLATVEDSLCFWGDKLGIKFGGFKFIL